QLYDRDGRLVETRSTGPMPGQDVVTFTIFDDANAKRWTSQPCVMPSLTTGTGGRASSATPGYLAPTALNNTSSAFVDPLVPGTNCSAGTIGGTTAYADALGRVIATDDAIGTGWGSSGSGCVLPGGTAHHTTCVVYSAVDAATAPGLASLNDQEPYLRALSIDANLHQAATDTDALGGQSSRQGFGGARQTPAAGVTPYALARTVQDATGAVREEHDPAGNVTTYTYGNTVGRLDSLSDPDRGTQTYRYDANGNITRT